MRITLASPGHVEYTTGGLRKEPRWFSRRFFTTTNGFHWLGTAVVFVVLRLLST
jgi:hypothetical protein